MRKTKNKKLKNKKFEILFVWLKNILRYFRLASYSRVRVYYFFSQNRASSSRYFGLASLAAFTRFYCEVILENYFQRLLADKTGSRAVFATSLCFVQRYKIRFQSVLMHIYCQLLTRHNPVWQRPYIICCTRRAPAGRNRSVFTAMEHSTDNGTQVFSEIGIYLEGRVRGDLTFFQLL